MSKNKKILALSLGLAVVFSTEDASGMKRKLDNFVYEDDGDLKKQDERPLLQKQSEVESYRNNVAFNEQSIFNRVDQAVLSHCNKNDSTDGAHEAFFAEVENLVVNEENLNQQDVDGNTLLHLAVLAGYQDIVELLVNNNADCSITNNNGETPFDLAVNEGHHDISRFLMDSE